MDGRGVSDERREVAARLRKAADSDEWLDMAINNAIFGVMGEVRRPIADTLAGLIGPTCEIVMDQVDDGEWGAHEIYECCSNCGNQNMRDRFTGKLHRYCPGCGARVVSADGH